MTEAHKKRACVAASNRFATHSGVGKWLDDEVYLFAADAEKTSKKTRRTRPGHWNGRASVCAGSCRGARRARLRRFFFFFFFSFSFFGRRGRELAVDTAPLGAQSPCLSR